MTSFRRLIRSRTIRAQVLMIQAVTLVLTVLLGFIVVVWYQRGQLNEQFEQRALAVAQTTAASVSLQQAVMNGDPKGEIERVESAVINAANVQFITITNMRGVPYTRMDQTATNGGIALGGIAESSPPAGVSSTDIQNGVLGLTAQGAAPLYDATHKLIGRVFVGISVASLSQGLNSSLPTLFIYMLVILAIGAVLSLALSRRLKRQTFGLELDEIAGLYQEREAMLRGIREGVIGVDGNGNILLVNERARRLLRLPLVLHGRPIAEVLPEGRLRDVVTGVIRGPDQIIVMGDRVVIANRMPIRANLRGHLGWVITFQDRTESEALLRELDTVVGLTDALRAQSHEFSNRLHTVLGLVQLGRNEEAISFVTDVASARNELNTHLLEAIDDPTLTALLLGKSATANERGVDLQVTTSTLIVIDPEALPDLLRLLGNLIDNAVDAAVQTPRSGSTPFVEVHLAPHGTTLDIEVHDSGVGITEEARSLIFNDGWSTKTSRTGARRGLGLALVREIIEHRDGTISVSNILGACFSLSLPSVVLVDDGDSSILVPYYQSKSESVQSEIELSEQVGPGRSS